MRLFFSISDVIFVPHIAMLDSGRPALLVPPVSAGATPNVGEASAAAPFGAPTWTTPLPVSPTQQVVKQFVPKLKLPEAVAPGKGEQTQKQGKLLDLGIRYFTK